MDSQVISLGVAVGGVALAAIAVVVAFNSTAVGQIRRQVEAQGRKIVRLKPKWVRSPFIAGLSPVAMVYRVTTQVGQEAAKVKLYAYDPGMWFSPSGSPVRQFSGGVWRDA